VGLKIQELIRNWGTCLNIVSCPMTVKKNKHSGDVFRKYRSGQGECTRKYKPRRNSSVHKQVSLLIIKIGGTCRDTNAAGCSVWRVFFFFLHTRTCVNFLAGHLSQLWCVDLTLSKVCVNLAFPRESVTFPRESHIIKS
jgi:hypothetical protein